MKKIIVTCPSCKKKMKILNKVAKYKCPNCKNIYKLNIFKLSVLRTKGVFTGIINTGKDINRNIKNKINSTRATYNYMKQMKKHMKQDPNWSNFHKEQKEMKNANKRSFKNFFKRK